MRFGVVVFPGSNCDADAYHVAKDVLGQPTRFIWHQESDLADVDCVILPGGFSYGDYLRTGSIARFSPVMRAVREHAALGGLLIGICNGFQVLCEAHLLPGALIQNRGLRFICQHVHTRVEGSKTPFTRALPDGDVLRMPIAHHGGSYYAEEKTLRELRDSGRVVLRYCDAQGQLTDDSNPNGSVESIAGICNEAGNVFGLMPHPERAAEPILGSVDGRRIFTSLLQSVA
ncbi:MAG TPA: phosphoribosylformylglycinamidine synthase subunit PurQ [Armatimonadota bacterium]|jgi:phosphoribosylformylglycinamidine synthase